MAPKFCQRCMSYYLGDKCCICGGKDLDNNIPDIFNDIFQGFGMNRKDKDEN